LTKSRSFESTRTSHPSPNQSTNPKRSINRSAGPVDPQGSAKGICAIEDDVTSLDKRDRQSLFISSVSLPNPSSSAAHVSLSSLYAIVKKPTQAIKPSQNLTNETTAFQQLPQPSLQLLFETPERRSSSAPEAPPSSSVSGL
jgi:hypothetical protein